MNKRLRVFWSSNAQWSPSGYGQAMADLLPLIRDEGYPVAISNFYGLAGLPIEWEGIKQYPVINHSFGSDAMLWHSKDFKADVTFSLQDVWVLNPQDIQQVTRWIPWVPVDHDPVPKGVINNLRFAHRIISMSQFGQEQLKVNGLASNYIPHMVDTKIFSPLNTQQEKQRNGIKPDTYVFGMVAANKDNPPRKSFQEVLDAFTLFLQKVPNSIIYIHTDPNFPGGFNIANYARFKGIESRVFFPGLQFPEIYKFKYNTGKTEMNQIYNTFDCLLAPSTSEGFGVPIIEAQACGIPVITSDWVAMKELVQDGINGYKVKASGYKWTSMESYAMTPDVNDLYDKMMLVYQAKRKEMKEAAHKFSLQYDLHTVFKNKWKPLLESLETEVYGPPVDNLGKKEENIK